MVHSVKYRVCRKCNRERMNKYYHSLKGDKKKKYIEMANRWNKTEEGKKYIKKYQKTYKKKNASKK